MKQSQFTLSVRTRGKGFIDITEALQAWVSEQSVNSGLLTVFCRHTSASLIIQENADPDVLRDLETFFYRAVPEDASLYRHTQEGKDDMPAHIRTMLTDVSVTIPVVGGRLALGTWQAVYLCEHRASAHLRALALHLSGE